MDSRKEWALVERMMVGDFNPNHDPDNGQFTSGSGGSGGGGSYSVGTKRSNMNYSEAESFASSAPDGTKITMSIHNTGDYVGEYTKKGDSWVGSQKYKSSFVTPPTVKTPKGFAMQVTGNDIEIIQGNVAGKSSGGSKQVKKSTPRNPKEMSVKEIEREITENRSSNMSRKAVSRNHSLMRELDRRYADAERKMGINGGFPNSK